MIRLSDIAEAGYCLRRAALIINEDMWADNQHTIEGSKVHERTHSRRTEYLPDGIIYHEFAVESTALGLHGLCDAVQFKESREGVIVPFWNTPVKIIPVEYKHGRLRDEWSYMLQLCGQALCLEGMFETSVPEGMLYFASSHRNKSVLLDDALRKETVQIIEQIKGIYENPNAVSHVEFSYSRKCSGCSFIELCSPEQPKTAKSYCTSIWE